MTLNLLIALQIVQVALLWLHDWLPLPPLNDVGAVQAADSKVRLVRVTLIQSLPLTVGLVGSFAAAATGHHPGWLWPWLWISYGLLFAGELRAWWLPYVVRPEPERVAHASRPGDPVLAQHALTPTTSPPLMTAKAVVRPSPLSRATRSQ